MAYCVKHDLHQVMSYYNDEWAGMVNLWCMGLGDSAGDTDRTNNLAEASFKVQSARAQSRN